VSADVAAGAALFAGNNCQGCHGGPKWTISQVFYTPGVAENAALLTKAWTQPAGFPAGLLPAATSTNRFMRFFGTTAASNDPTLTPNFDQMQCILRPVGTFGVADATVAADASFEVRANMSSKAQGSEVDGNGYNPPSLLGLATGAPYLHAGNAQTLESMLSDTFHAHHQSLSPNFLQAADSNAPLYRKQIIAYLLSIDTSTATVMIPSVGSSGGNFCVAP
jgi:cytochrome c peroxidase